MINQIVGMGFSSVITRNRIIRRVGIDADILVSLMEKSDDFAISKPRIFTKNHVLYICQKVFSQVLGVLIHINKKSLEEARNQLLNFLRQNRITILKNRDIGFDKINVLLADLKEKRKKIKSTPDDMDLEIMAIYKLANIDVIITRNVFHFQELCKELDIYVERPESDLDIMLKRVFPKKRKYKK